MEINNNEKGFTLIEVLVSLVILSIIFLSILRLFPQMGLMNKVNEDKTQAINTAKQLLIDWQNSVEVQNYLEDPTTGSLPGFVKAEGDYYYCTTTKGEFTANIKIKQTTDLTSAATASPFEVHYIEIQLLNKRNSVVSEIYGYIRF
ncbi:type IV pilus modification PilV family protein [Bacillaceae bacterium C204]|jgi:prepilin-type N-terminal cleavage/methylation domain-containing protein|uniref:type IV pilus modification PilV family protein n=1 Tax=Neobacillus sp. 204 TaxID=3383351 RepID=UPI00397E6875